jgi:LysR family glycine cleavage system transcriptional activator
MPYSTTRHLRNLPSLRALHVFNTVGRHLNLVHAAVELNLTQSALSKQIKLLEDHLGVKLFERGPRGLRLTEDGGLLLESTNRGLQVIGNGIQRVQQAPAQHSLVISAPRSFAACSLASRLPGFVRAHPWISPVLDVHRLHSHRAAADVTITLGHAGGDEENQLTLSDDEVCAIAAPHYLQALAEDTPTVLLRNSERDYWEMWESADLPMPQGATRTVFVNDTVVMLETAEAGGGIALTRRCLLDRYRRAGTLVDAPAGAAIHDGLRYVAVFPRKTSVPDAQLAFRKWLGEEYGPG